MADILCPRCLEPCDVLEISEFLADAGISMEDYHAGNGCDVCYGKPVTANEGTIGILHNRILHRMLGDDLDGIASITQDLI